MNFKHKNLLALGDVVCGNLGAETPGPGQEPKYFPYRSSMFISEFFEDLGTDYRHDGSTRNWWVADVIEKMLAEPHDGPTHPPEIFCRLIDQLMDPRDAHNEEPDRPNALRQLNEVLAREGFEAFYAEDKHCYLRHVGSQEVTLLAANPHRPLSPVEVQRRNDLAAYLDACSEDDLIEEVLLPLFRQLGFHRITAAGHKDKALEYGKDVWMRLTLPTQHRLYFGVQAKRGKIDASGTTNAGNANVAEILNQAQMMLAHEIFDPEDNRRVLIDHAFIVAGGEITKQARNWLGNALDASRRSQIMFIDRDDILNLYVVTNLPLPAAALPVAPSSPAYPDEPPF
ncbi:MAG: hypothetical protein J0I40_10155 [Cellulomonas sp.]|uniref:hypothetical protein n=1 Tax=Cellulomonas sp. 73-92 TaxID=1895740 RepID=UPI000927589A|nr:hypothetical protein [Cellulomonas sp. 73-92]MBN9375735.1 hypothetical protein [Cellulomonas sp.]OJV81701.1 MAG: hypothetical protein BGO37_07815 [Cellulomonas sp. 73-92]